MWSGFGQYLVIYGASRQGEQALGTACTPRVCRNTVNLSRSRKRYRGTPHVTFSTEMDQD